MILPLNEVRMMVPPVDQSTTDTISSMDAAKTISKVDCTVPQISFSHVQIYVDHIEDLGVYKDLETSLNEFDSRLCSKNEEQDDDGKDFVSSQDTLLESRLLWQSLRYGAVQDEGVQPFVPQNRDIVKQLLVGFGMRVTGACQGNGTVSVLVTSKDSFGIQIVITAKDDASVLTPSGDKGLYHHFDSVNLDRFFHRLNDRQGIAVLGFQVEDIDLIRQKYERLHPNLIHSYHEYEFDGSTTGPTKVFEVYAYYAGESTPMQPDNGTLIRFVETDGFGKDSQFCILPGLVEIPATFDSTSRPAYFDHWVSNVYSRTQFLDTLNDTLGFTPKVDFNAGVVAAGEAQIESTVTGNESRFKSSDKAATLRDQSQVYLPINNAISNVGHVHGFLDEIGQGIQHIANRVENLVDFVQRCNDYREITGEGFTFLNIPRSYYGVLSPKYLADGSGISIELAEAVVNECTDRGVASSDGAVDLEMSKDTLSSILDIAIIGSTMREEYEAKKFSIVETVLKSRYSNVFSLLRNHVSESTYLSIVKNQILCDVQGDDVLYQIFTCGILQREEGLESPFFEFIQRVCSQCEGENGCPAEIKPGCGGFGIRNFLTLFLSIEVSKAMLEVSAATRKGDDKGRILSQKKVDCFTDQLNEANPILTQISDAMTEEGHCLVQLNLAEKNGDNDAAIGWKEMMEAAQVRKLAASERLMECSHRYQDKMRLLREEAECQF